MGFYEYLVFTATAVTLASDMNGYDSDENFTILLGDFMDKDNIPIWKRIKSNLDISRCNAPILIEYCNDYAIDYVIRYESNPSGPPRHERTMLYLDVSKSSLALLKLTFQIECHFGSLYTLIR